MTFLNWTMLIGLGALAIPIVIHLLNRSRARVVDWGAMRFLEASLASRSRRILIEEIILLILRCLVVALAVLAMARPFLPSRPTALVLLGIPAVVAAAICAALAAAMWAEKRLRRIFLLATLLLVSVPAVAGALEQAYQSSRWSFGGGEKDVAIVLDGSMSMALRGGDGNTNFSRAVAEAESVVASCSPADGISLVVAGASPRAVLARTTSNRKDIASALSGLEPGGGSMRVVQALRMASQSLSEGANPAKKIVLITDGQYVGWDVRTEARWRFLGRALAEHPTPPHVIVRTLDVPESFTNLAVTEVALDRTVIGTDRKVAVSVKIANTGTEPAGSAGVRLEVDGAEVGTETVEEVLPNAAETVRFRHRFASPGRHVLSVRLEAEDDLPEDNAAERVVDVLRELRVLIVDGTPSMAPLEGAGEFIEIALAPPPADAPAGTEAARDREEYDACLVRARLVDAPDIKEVESLDPYAAVVLADVPLLPDAFAESLAAFVAKGGGLLIAPGPEAKTDFYDTWSAGGQPVTPAKLGELRSVGEEPVRLALQSFSHPALAKTADESASDALSAVVTAYRVLQPPEKDRAVSVGGRLATGEPLLIERKLGKGHVLMAATVLHPRATNLPALECFVPLVHELVYYLASPAVVRCNVESGSDVTLELRRPDDPDAPDGTGLKAEYFADMGFKKLRHVRVDRQVDFDWGEAAPAPDVPRDGFAVRWTGQIEPPATGEYTFRTVSDDGVRLWVAGKRIINDWSDHGVEERSGKVRLKADQKVPIRLEYYDSASQAVCKLQWSGPKLSRRVVPMARLYNDAGPAATPLRQGDVLEVVTPSGAARPATVVRGRDPIRVSFTETHEPGLYRLKIPDALAGRYAAMNPRGQGMPFTVLDSGDESALAMVTEADFQTARRSLLEELPEADPIKTLARVESTGELTAAVSGGIPGRELWQYLAIVLIAVLVAEIALTRWIAVQRRVHTVRAVDFGSETVDVDTFRRRAEEMLGEPQRSAEPASTE